MRDSKWYTRKNQLNTNQSNNIRVEEQKKKNYKKCRKHSKMAKKILPYQ